MNSFWSAWIMFLIVLNLGITFFLYVWGQRVEIPTLEDGTTGHVWAHGVLKESVRKLPLWWVLMSGAMFAVGFVYLVLYPGFGANKGTLGWTAHGELQGDLDANAARLAPLLARIDATSIEQLTGDSAATDYGRRLFVDNCAACHGREGHGNPVLGAPNVVDADWLYGGTGTAVLSSILDGRRGTMPPMGDSLGAEGIVKVAHYVQSLSGASHSASQAAAGKALFGVCAACHGVDGKGNQALGAPNLTDNTWLYGGSRETIETTIQKGRSGLMPAWRGRLDETDAKAIAAWILSQSQAHPVR